MFKKIFVLLLLLSIFAKGREIIVSPDGQLSSIKKALTQANNGDVIKLKKGVYREYNIEITKSVKIIGESGVVIDGEKKGQIIHILADGVELRNFTVQNVGSDISTIYAAVRLSSCQDFFISNLVLKNFLYGFYLSQVANGTLQNNQLYGASLNDYDSGSGVHFWNVKNVKVLNNEITGSRDGIYIERSADCIIKGNHSYKNIRYGLHFMFSDGNKYVNNVFENNATGVAVMYSNKIKMINNSFKQSWGASAYGLLLKEISDAEITGNKFYKNTTGIQIEGTNRINYKGNQFERNGWALKVKGASYDNHFIKNNFINNSFELSYRGGINNNSFEQNYWSDYTGYDLDKDGFGDVPHRPVKLFSYLVNETPEAIILLRSLFIDIINFSEKVSPVFTPDNLVDSQPKMIPYK
ncbi:nitrous oxide reductase family maturation protein NosD [Candidatus Ornithobacterium hominis]|uniref:Nitrous oxide reductase family maturation protein NosD n=1 Tax=Candidatus Ornithobacterium hominis TaxID=2497989 RepID=A0A383TVN9_9FLAO|nr:nitrous oxide reductase family maturation protein NosD [Candidatus Ornithobacterium hominis]MCT7904403.1 nitrous oxide reductase family maturation protein NosD [Candidatus Ornithobacterium hominis]SZD71300.1 nitrous oxide reductase family maturation protein NosD [Candidatus Ornithobacterium hominis]SZD71977.1 nitrous oxide reductase family maturation protein NosD [Candidatus Ornithobacterium hominis]